MLIRTPHVGPSLCCLLVSLRLTTLAVSGNLMNFQRLKVGKEVLLGEATSNWEHRLVIPLLLLSVVEDKIIRSRFNGSIFE